MCALKTTAKKSELPLLTSAFFRNHMMPHWYVAAVLLYGITCIKSVLQRTVSTYALRLEDDITCNNLTEIFLGRGPTNN